ncbi:MAG: aldose epimerase family protein [Ignavibacteriaceae bacterium]
MEIITKHIEHKALFSTGSLDSFDLKNQNGMSVTILNYGATIAKIEVPDRNGEIGDVILGHDNLLNFINGRYYLGATVGRYANRIKGGHFTIDEEKFQVSVNKSGNLLHGGFEGFDKKFWLYRIIQSSTGAALELSHISPDGDEGFPGTMAVKVIYSLTDKNELKMNYFATTDKPTVVNLTNHSYFNLTGSASNTILDHVLKINANEFTPTDSFSIPTGDIKNVAETPLDFRTPSVVGKYINDDYEQLEIAKGYDQNFVLNNFNGEVKEAANLYDPLSGRFVEVLTDQPGIQFYSGNYLDGTLTGKGGIKYKKRSALCLECQHFPNSPNENNFPPVILRPGELYKQTTIYKFSTLAESISNY